MEMPCADFLSLGMMYCLDKGVVLFSLHLIPYVYQLYMDQHIHKRFTSNLKLKLFKEGKI